MVMLGLEFHKEYCVFRMFSPEAEKAEVVLYESAREENGKAFLMKQEKDGIWNATIRETLENKFYMYRITDKQGKTSIGRDPYAVAVGINGSRSAIVDLEKTNPQDFEKYKKVALASPTDAVIYEAHIRDFTMGENIPFQYRGKFLGMIERGLKTKSGRSAGMDSLLELGITHIQILPFYDSAAVDEEKVDEAAYKGRKYNWGYDPHNYNVPEGNYATNPYDPSCRIRECKEMIAGFHKVGIGVIMDVVYNHTFSVEDGPFEKTAPGYFYRMNGTEYANGSGCGNEIASEKPMVRQYIKDSLKYWVKEYGVDGFRFDLMGLLDRQTMKEIGEELRRELRQDILLYGEPWQAGGSVLPYEQQMVKGAQRKLGIGVFNDNIRDALRGSTRGRDGAFVLGRKGFEREIVDSVKGSINTFADIPSESINYAGAHDDLNLWDKVITSLGQRQAEGFLNMQDGRLKRGNLEHALQRATLHHGITKDNLWENQAVRACVLADAIVLTSQGIPFMYAGDELLRSKYGDPNTYQSGDKINTIPWEDKDKFEPVYDFYRKLIAFRKQHPAFRMNSRQMVEEKLHIIYEKNGVVGYILGEYANGDTSRYLCVFYNGNSSEKQVQLPGGENWKILIQTPGEAHPKNGDNIVLAGTSMQIWEA